jgi:putative NADH-flavin reductase
VRVALFGGTGTIGSRIVAECRSRGHDLTLVLRDPAKAPPPAKTRVGDVTSAASVAAAVRNDDAVVSAVGPSGGAPTLVVDAARALVAGLREAGVGRLLVVGGAGSLEVSPGHLLYNAPDFPPAWRAIAVAHHEALRVYQAVEDLDWTYFSPAALIGPGMRTGHYRIGFDSLVVNATGESRISAEDYAVALVDELEQDRHKKRRITVAY